jgi:CubicO group peptidase (beta-lactamase class C family)
MWWVTHDEDGSFMARRVHGQALYINPTAQVVIVRFASHPVAGNAANDPAGSKLKCNTLTRLMCWHDPELSASWHR